MKPSEIIRHGKSELLERGFARGRMLDSEGRVCSLGAIALSENTEDDVLVKDFRLFTDRGPLFDAARYISRGFDHKVSDDEDVIDSIWRSSDSCESFDEVIDAFDKAEKLAEQAENA